MTRLPDDFHQDRALRDAARGVLMADIEHAKTSLSKDGLTNRVTSRIQDGAKDALEVTKGHAADKSGLIAGVIALLALWFARQPLMEIFGLAEANDGHEVESTEPLGEEATDKGETPDD